MHLYVLADAFGLAVLVGFALDQRVLAHLVMMLHFVVGQHFITPEFLINACELQIL